jgi:hypothetical protein
MARAKKLGKKGRSRYTFCHWYEYYLYRLGKLKLPNYVRKYDEGLDQSS